MPLQAPAGIGAGDRAGEFGLMLQNLAAVAANYRRAGVQLFVLAYFVRSSGEVQGVREALGLPLRVARLTVRLPDIERRLASDVTSGRREDLRAAMAAARMIVCTGTATAWRGMPGSPMVRVTARHGGVPAVPAPPGRDPGRHAPVIVLSPSRSYSSVVTTMIGCHPELYGFPELLLWTSATVGELLTDPAREGSPTAPAFPAGLVRTIAELHHGAQGPDEVAVAQTWLLARQSWPTCDVQDHLLELVTPRRGVEKSPQTVTDRAALERAARAYPGARFIHLTRHPATALPSIYEHWLWSRRMHGMATDLPHDEAACQWVACAAAWLVAHRNAVEFGARAGPGRVLRVRGEDVLANPRQELTRIARWLGVGDDPRAVEEMLHPERAAFAKQGPTGARYGNDRKFLAEPVPHPVRCPRGHRLPASIRLAPELVTRVERLAADLGY